MLTTDLAQKICPGRPPASLHAGNRYAQQLGRLLHREPAEESKLDDPGLLHVQSRQPRQRRVEVQQIGRAILEGHQRGIQRLTGRAAPALLRATASGMIHQDAPHRLGSGTVKVRSVVPARLILPGQPHEGLVNECRRLKRVTASLLPHGCLGQIVKFVVDQRRKSFPGLAMTATGLGQKLRDMVRPGIHRVDPNNQRGFPDGLLVWIAPDRSEGIGVGPTPFITI